VQQAGQKPCRTTHTTPGPHAPPKHTGPISEVPQRPAVPRNKPTSGSLRKPAPRTSGSLRKPAPRSAQQADQWLVAQASSSERHPPTARPPSGTLPTFPTHSAAPQRRAADPTARYQPTLTNYLMPTQASLCLTTKDTRASPAQSRDPANALSSPPSAACNAFVGKAPASPVKISKTTKRYDWDLGYCRPSHRDRPHCIAKTLGMPMQTLRLTSPDSDDIASMVVKGIMCYWAPSSLEKALYTWTKFTSWCRLNGVRGFKPTGADVARFLQHIARTAHRMPNGRALSIPMPFLIEEAATDSSSPLPARLYCSWSLRAPSGAYDSNKRNQWHYQGQLTRRRAASKPSLFERNILTPTNSNHASYGFPSKETSFSCEPAHGRDIRAALRSIPSAICKVPTANLARMATR